MQCREEATESDHQGHGHSHGGHGHSHGGDGHQCGPDDPDGQSLLPFIDTEKVTCLNEREAESGKLVFKSYVDKLDESKFLESEEDDAELILHIPFTVAVRLKSFCIIGGANGEAPSRVKLFTNREDIDFEVANDLPPVQELELTEDFEDSTKITFIGLKGESTGARRAVVECTYEASAQLKDHQTTRADLNARSELS